MRIRSMAKIAFEHEQLKVAVIDKRILEITVAGKSFTLDEDNTAELIRFVSNNMKKTPPFATPDQVLYRHVDTTPVFQPPWTVTCGDSPGFNPQAFGDEGGGKLLSPEELKRKFPGMNTTRSIDGST
jgi:hypothetical protein